MKKLLLLLLGSLIILNFAVCHKQTKKKPEVNTEEKLKKENKDKNIDE
jgi:hypothetical protein